MNSDIGQRLEEELIEKTKKWLETAIELEDEWDDDWSEILEIFKAIPKKYPAIIEIPHKIVPINPDSKISEEVVNKLVDRFPNSEKVQPP